MTVTPASCLAIAEATIETPENFRVRRELIAALKDLVTVTAVPTPRDHLAIIAHDVMFPDSHEDMMTWPPSLFAIADAILAAGYKKESQP